VRDFVALELEQVDGVHPGRTVVADQVLHHHQVFPVDDPPGVEDESSRVLAPPFPEVLHAFEPLTGLGKLQHGVVVVDLVGDVLVAPRVVPVAFERDHEISVVEHCSPRHLGVSNLALERLGREGRQRMWVPKPARISYPRPAVSTSTRVVRRTWAACSGS